MSEQPSVVDTPEPDTTESQAPEPQTPESQSFDAELILEEIATGEQEAPQVDFDQDYEASKQFDASTSPDQANQTSKFDKSASASPTDSEESLVTGNPGDFLEMAKEIAPDPENSSN
jgi:hypothetical protein